eukprot:gene24113-193_t
MASTYSYLCRGMIRKGLLTKRFYPYLVETGAEFPRGDSAPRCSTKTQVLSASADRTIRLWSTDTASELLKFEGHTAVVFSAFFSKDESRVLSVSDDSTIGLWSTDTANELLTLEGHSGIISTGFLVYPGMIADGRIL